MSTLEMLLVGKATIVVMSYWSRRQDAKDLLLLRSRGTARYERKLTYPVNDQTKAVNKREILINIKGAAR